MFNAMAWLLHLVTRDAIGYAEYLSGSYLLALLVMLPTTLCAGTTLPLITHALLRQAQDEANIGKVYAANTFGGIVGVLVTMHLLMPVLGLRNAIVIGAAIDLAAGCALFLQAGGARDRRLLWAVELSMAVVVLIVRVVEFDPLVTASGVYRHGRARLPNSEKSLFHADGKTASIDLVQDYAGSVAILTNGKPDAAIEMAAGKPASEDEVTMVLAAVVPLAMRPQAHLAANIGMGSGLTTATILGSSRLERVDTIEIEAKMVEAAAGFRPRTDRVYTDPRSHIVIDDAKTYFTAQRQRYDIIVSEPSNPWVNGVAGLFSLEFYDLIKHFITADGVLVQWLQLYEFNAPLMASVANALGQHFAHYVIYQTDDADVLIVASDSADLETVDPYVFTEPVLAGELRRVGIRQPADLRIHHVGNRATLAPLFRSYGAPANSDDYPYLDQHAASARFMQSRFTALLGLTGAPLPLLEMLDPYRG